MSDPEKNVGMTEFLNEGNPILGTLKLNHKFSIKFNLNSWLIFINIITNNKNYRLVIHISFHIILKGISKYRISDFIVNEVD